jgi:hypothetical protein
MTRNHARDEKLASDEEPRATKSEDEAKGRAFIY